MNRPLLRAAPELPFERSFELMLDASPVIGQATAWQRRIDYFEYASTSTMRATPSGDPLTTTLIFEVVMDAKAIFRHARLLPVIEAPGIVNQLTPSQN